MSDLPQRSCVSREGASAEAASSPAVIVMHHRGQVHSVPYHAGETLLETARRAGVPLDFNCERGECGTCMVTILSGAVKMNANLVLSEDDIRSGLALGCQSVPVTKIIEIEIS
jgi:3-ketosteroid 9alpha-monooxygenase subunit B